MRWINQPTKNIIRDVLIEKLNRKPRMVEDLCDRFSVTGYNPVQRYEIERNLTWLEKRGKVKRCPLSLGYMRTNSKYKFHWEVISYPEKFH